jgi:hypothetical protein
MKWFSALVRDKRNFAAATIHRCDKILTSNKLHHFNLSINIASLLISFITNKEWVKKRLQSGLNCEFNKKDAL